MAANASLVIAEDAGLNWTNNSLRAAVLAVHRPADYVQLTPVTIKLLIRAVEDLAPPNSKVQFFARPRDYNSGDPFLDASDTASNVVSLSGNGVFEAVITFPSNGLVKDWWEITIQRDDAVPGGYTQPVRVLSVEMLYTGWVSGGAP